MINLFLLFLALFGCIFVLWWAGDLSVKYSAQTASFFKVTTLFIGFFLISISTGFPELAVIVVSRFNDVSSIALGNTIGSIIADVGFALAFAAFFAPAIVITRRESISLLIMLMFSSLLLGIVYFLGRISFPLSIFLIFSYFVLIWWVWKDGKTKIYPKEEEIAKDVKEVLDVSLKQKKFWLSKWGVVIKLLGSLMLIFVFSDIATRLVVSIASKIGMKLETLGVTIFAIGTSLPELTFNLSAIRKREYALALGNIVGSIFEEASLLLGLTALFSKEVPTMEHLYSAAPYLILLLGIMGYALLKSCAIKKVHAFLMALVFIVFLYRHLFLLTQ